MYSYRMHICIIFRSYHIHAHTHARMEASKHLYTHTRARARTAASSLLYTHRNIELHFTLVFSSSGYPTGYWD